MVEKNVKAVNYVAASNEKITKSEGGKGFYIPVQYKLENGELIDGRIGRKRKKDVQAELDRGPRYLYAEYRDGKYIGMVSIYSLV